MKSPEQLEQEHAELENILIQTADALVQQQHDFKTEMVQLRSTFVKTKTMQNDDEALMTMKR